MWYGSTTNYVNFTEAKVEKLSNAVRITLQADGTLQTNADFEGYWHWDDSIGDWNLTETKRFTLNVVNARSQIGRFVDVGEYPVDHVSLTVPADAPSGVGLEVTTYLYAPAVVGKLSAWGSDEDWTFATWFDRRIDMTLSDDRRQLIITCLSDLPAEATTVTPPAPGRRQSLIVDRVDGSVRLRALNAPLLEVAAKLTEVTGQQVVVGPGVEKQITANLPAMEPRALLEALCHASCLGITWEDGKATISRGVVDDVAPYWTAETRRIHLEHLAVDDAVLMLPTFILPRVKPDTEGNSVVATGPAVLLDKVERDLRHLDQPVRQICVEAMLIEIADTRQLDRVLSLLGQTGTTFVDYAPVKGSLQVSVSEQRFTNIEARLKSLAASGAVRLQAQPEVAVLSGKGAQVFSGDRLVYPYTSTYWWGINVSLQRVDAGITLAAIPWAGDDHTVSLQYGLSVGAVTSRDRQGAPTLTRQEASGSLRITDGQTVIFGGLRSRDRSTQKLGANPLASAGLIGDLLSDQTSRSQDRQVLLCLSARVLPAPPLAQRSEPPAGGDAEPATGSAAGPSRKPPPWLRSGPLSTSAENRPANTTRPTQIGALAPGW